MMKLMSVEDADIVSKLHKVISCHLTHESGIISLPLALPAKCKYRISANICGELNLAVWQLRLELPN